MSASTIQITEILGKILSPFLDHSFSLWESFHDVRLIEAFIRIINIFPKIFLNELCFFCTCFRQQQRNLVIARILNFFFLILCKHVIACEMFDTESTAQVGCCHHRTQVRGRLHFNFVEFTADNLFKLWQVLIL